VSTRYLTFGVRKIEEIPGVSRNRFSMELRSYCAALQVIISDDLSQL